MGVDMVFSMALTTFFKVRDFKPCAYYTLHDVKVLTKDCSYTAERLNEWVDIFWENHRPWYTPWRKCVGFSVYCPPAFELSGTILVVDVLDVIPAVHAESTERYKTLLYRLAKGLTVYIAE